MSKKILVIDDEEAVRNSFKLALEDTDFEVNVAESGEKGLELFNQENPDLVFLDLKMPGMNGVAVLNAIREVNLEVPVYIVTAFYKEFLDLLEAAVKKGIPFEVMNKPIGAEQIVAVSKSALEKPETY